ncbi:MAG TPA: DUF3501 family protein [Steroidobacteraceae bacterium]|nr:DUF3501 family protein [Steroidobacteraceae bacterium]
MEKVAGRGALTAADLLGLEQYAKGREAFRADVIRHKRARTVRVGPDMTWIFEDRKTIQYQLQEMLRIERIFEPPGIRDELDTYNPLIPDGSNWKVTMMIEYPDPVERQAALARMRGIEERCYVEVAGCGRVVAIADEDLVRENAEKTSAVHWLRFELTPAMKDAIRAGVPVSAGTDHPAYRHSTRLPAETLRALSLDLD